MDTGLLIGCAIVPTECSTLSVRLVICLWYECDAMSGA